MPGTRWPSLLFVGALHIFGRGVPCVALSPRRSSSRLAATADVAAAPSVATTSSEPDAEEPLPVYDAVDSAYVTYVSGRKYLAYSLVLTASLHDLNHTRPHVFLVKRGSPEAMAAKQLEQAAKKQGWNLKFEVYNPITVPWKTIFEFWDEAWQRVTMYDMGNRFRRVMHLDSDVVLFRNVEDILDTAPIPTLARRMGGCQSPQGDFCSTRPVTNVMVVEPNATIAEMLRAWVKKYTIEHDTSDHGPDETTQLQFYPKHHFLGYNDAIYFDCYMRNSDKDLKDLGLSIEKMPRAVHLGIPFKGIVETNQFTELREALDFVKHLQRDGRKFQATVAGRWYELYFSEPVQALLRKYDELARMPLRDGVADVCD